MSKLVALASAIVPQKKKPIVSQVPPLLSTMSCCDMKYLPNLMAMHSHLQVLDWTVTEKAASLSLRRQVVPVKTQIA